MAVTTASFLAHYPDFSGFTETQIQGLLDFCGEQHCPVAGGWTGAKRDRGIMLRVAHYLETQRLQQAESAASAASVAAGESKTPSAGEGDDLSRTTYGRQFKELRRTLPTRTGIAF